MARSRNIKPGLFKNEILGVADPIYTLAFEGLWLLADKAGRLEDRPLRIKAETFPYRDGLNIEAILDWLVTAKFIVRYALNGKRYIEIINFTKHQNPHKNEAESEIPPPPSVEVPINSEDVLNNSEPLGLIPDSLNLIPDSCSTRTSALPPKQSLDLTVLPKNLSPAVWQDFVKHRKGKRAPINTQTVVNSIADELRKAEASGWPPDAALTEAMAAGWTGIKLEWLDNRRQTNAKNQHDGRSRAKRVSDTLDEIARESIERERMRERTIDGTLDRGDP